MKILFIEDDNVFAQTLIEFLLKEGHLVTYCENVIDFHQAIHTDQYDLALLDLMLPPRIISL